VELLDRAAALSACAVIAALAPGAVVALAARAQPITFPAGAAVTVPAESVLVIAAGEVELADGRIARSGDELGLAAAVAGVAQVEHGTARGDVVGLAVLRDELLDLVAEDAHAVRALTAQLAAAVRATRGRAP
jgi:hypothetical protein